MKLLRPWLLVVLFAVAGEPGLHAEAPAKPNVLLIAVDDLNHWVGYLGRNKQTITPNIDKLAARGVRFTRSYCASPSCNPSRTALLSGMRPSTTGIYSNSEDWRPVVPEELTLPTTFRKAGYYVAGSGKVYHSAYPRPSEWDDYLEEPQSEPRAKKAGLPAVKLLYAGLDCNDEEMVDYAIASYAVEQLQKNHDRPFFLVCGVHRPHQPWFVPRKYFDLHPLDQIELPAYLENDLDDLPRSGLRMAKPALHDTVVEAGRWKEAIQAYLAAISFTDMNVGRVLDALDRSPYKDNTIVVFFGDHGYHLGEKHHWHKGTLWEEATRAPLIWVVPGLTKPGGVCERTVDFMDIYPTLTDLCGLPTPSHVEGQSIRTLLADPKAVSDRPALTTCLFKNHAVRTEGWRYIRYANGDEELYNEIQDPYEWTNLATKPEFAAKKAELAKYLPMTNAPDVEGKPKRSGKRDATKSIVK